MKWFEGSITDMTQKFDIDSKTKVSRQKNPHKHMHMYTHTHAQDMNTHSSCGYFVAVFPAPKDVNARLFSMNWSNICKTKNSIIRVLKKKSDCLLFFAHKSID